MTSRSKLPATVYLLGATIFSLVTAEFMVAGMMPALADAFSVSLAQVGNLIAFYAILDKWEIGFGAVESAGLNEENIK